VIFGRSPVARYLAALAHEMNFSVTILAEGASRQDFPNADVIHDSLQISPAQNSVSAYLVVSTQGESDEEALEAALRTHATYIAFVASRKKAEKVFEYLRAEGIAAEQLNRVHSPAGLNIGARAPEEIALSILAEIVQTRRSKPRVESAATIAPEMRDPVCGMLVNASRAKHFSERDGQTFFFCCGHCKQQFENDPAKYLVS